MAVVLGPTTQLPHKLSDNSFDGPGRLTWIDGGDAVIATSDRTLSSTSYNPPSLSFAFETNSSGHGEIGRSTVQHSLSGLVLGTKRWHDVQGDRSYSDSTKYDNLGRAIETTDPVGTITQRDYDALDRVVEVRVGTSTSGANAPAVVTRYFYDSGGTTTQGVGNGNLTLIQDFANGTGSGTTPRQTVQYFDFRDRLFMSLPPLPPYACRAYDNLDRLTESAVFSSTPTAIDNPLTDRGRYSKTLYSHRGLAFRELIARDATSSSPTFLQSDSWFDANGRVVAVRTPDSPMTKSVLDGLGRVSRRYVCDHGGDTDPGSTSASVYSDAVVVLVPSATTFVYDGNDHLSLRVAHLVTGTSSSPVDSVQITQYLYGTETSSSPGSADSLVASKDLLREVRYPKSDTGLPPGDSDTALNANRVRYAYNRVGETRATIDQNGTQHTLTRDALGRVTDDTASFASGTTVDQTVDRLALTFDGFGRPERAKSIGPVSGTPTVLNEVLFAYTPLWKVASVEQDVDSQITSGSGVSAKTVGYSYKTSGGNSNRLEGIDYPDGYKQLFTYLATGGTSGTADDAISRVVFTDFAYSTGSPSPLAAYSYVGLSRPSLVNYPSRHVQLDRTLNNLGNRHFGSIATQPSGIYASWDRFGRDKYLAWVDDELTAGTGRPDRPPLVTDSYAHDKLSNRTGSDNALPTLAWSVQDYELAYDGLDRLRTATRGMRDDSGTNPFSSVTANRRVWEFDAIGNWSRLGYDDDSNGQINGTEQTEARTNDLDNQMTDLADPTACQSGSTQFSYDARGSLIQQSWNPYVNCANHSAGTVARVRQWKYDAWNRLVRVTDTTGTNSPVDTAVYQHNALNWRTIRQNQVGSGQPIRHAMYYSANWQLLQEDIDLDYSTTSPQDERRVQYYWGVRALDDLIMRQANTLANDTSAPTYEAAEFYLADGQGSVIGAVDGIAAVNPGSTPPVPFLGREAYSSYGQAIHYAYGDVNGTGNVSVQDLYDFLAMYFSGAFLADINRSGGVSVQDLYDFLALYFGTAMPDHTMGYCGYVFDDVTGEYLARNRNYRPDIGRWLQRDPAGYVDGSSLYEYVQSSPFGASDPQGLDCPRTWADELALAGFDNDLIELLLKTKVEANQDAERAARFQMELEDSFSYKLSGGFERTINALSFGLTDEFGGTDSQRYQGSGYEWSERVAGLAREAGITAFTLGAGNVVTAGRAGVGLESLYTAARGYEAFNAVRSAYNAGGDLSNGNYLSAGFNLASAGLGIVGARGTPSSLSRSSIASSAEAASRLRNRLIAEEIAGGHGFAKHVLGRRGPTGTNEFVGLGVRTRQQYANHLQAVLNDSNTLVRQLPKGRTGFLHSETGTVIIRHPAAPDGGTAFRPPVGNLDNYFWNELH